MQHQTQHTQTQKAHACTHKTHTHIQTQTDTAQHTGTLHLPSFQSKMII